MSRNLTTQMQDVVQDKVIFPIIFLEADFDSGAVRLWSGVGDLVWNGYTWTGGGSLLKVDSIEESNEIKAVGTTVALSGIPSDLLSIALQEDYQGRELKIYLGAFSVETQFLSQENGDYILKEDGGRLYLLTETDIISDPVILFSGRIDTMTIQESGETSTIQLTVENRLIDFERTKERRYTSEDQKIDYPTDKGLEFVTSIQDKEIVWGRV